MKIEFVRLGHPGNRIHQHVFDVVFIGRYVFRPFQPQRTVKVLIEFLPRIVERYSTFEQKAVKGISCALGVEFNSQVE